MKLKKPNKSPLKLDPTRTVTLRRMFEQAFNKRFTELKKRITKLVVTDDCFGLKNSNHDPFTVNANDGPNPYTLQHQIVTHIRKVLAQKPGQTIASFKDVRMTLPMLDKSEFDYHVLNMRTLGLLKLYVEPEPVKLDHASLDWMVRERNLDSPDAYGGWIYYNGVSIVPTTNTAFKFHSTPERIKAFQSWLKQQVSILLLTEGDTSWWRKYIVDGFKKGQGRVFDDFSDKAADITDTQRQFLKGAFNNLVSEERVDVLSSRVFTELKGVTDAMAQQISRELTDGLTQGLNPVDIAKNLNAKVDGIGKNRARMIAQTETIRAHAEGQLDELERMGVKHVGVQVEFSSAHDNRTCPICRKLDNKKYTLEKARGIIPVHVCCRCCFRPVVPTDLLEGTKDDETPEEETTETEEAVQPKPSLWSKVKGWFIGNVEHPTTWTAEEIEDNFTGAEE